MNNLYAITNPNIFPAVLSNACSLAASILCYGTLWTLTIFLLSNVSDFILILFCFVFLILDDKEAHDTAVT